MQNVQSLSFDAIRENFIALVKETPAFRDVNFKASGISTFIDLLAYNTHYIGYYVKMLMNESFTDTARTREAMMSHAKTVGYTPKSVRASRANLYLEVEVPNAQDPDDHVIIVPRGQTFSAASLNSDNTIKIKRTFVAVDDFYLSSRTPGVTSVFYRNPVQPATPLPVYEGALKEWKFLVDSGVEYQKYVVNEAGVDYESIRVSVYETENSSEFETYNLAQKTTEVTSTSKVFYITTNSIGRYEIFFGDGVFGQALTTGNKIVVTYIVTSGAAANGAGSGGAWSVDDTLPSGRVAEIDLTFPTPVSDGGADEESIDSLRFSIPNHYRRQNRIVNEQDYRDVILSEYGNVDGINVWGGEKAYRKEFGKVFISIKPKYATKLSAAAKNEIYTKIIKDYNVVGTDVVFVDPEFISINLRAHVTFDQTKTTSSWGQVQSIVTSAIREYETLYMNRFDSVFSEVDFLDFIRSKNKGIKSVYIIKTISKDIVVRYTNPISQIVHYGNALRAGTMISDAFTYASTPAELYDDGGGVLFMRGSVNKTKLLPEGVGSVDYEAGIVTLDMPKSGFHMTGADDLVTSGLLRMRSESVAPDVKSYLNNIVVIGEIKEPKQNA